MIIKNNFNNKSIDPLDDYQSIGKTRDNSMDNEFNTLNNDTKDIIEDILKSDHAFDEDDDDKGDKWDFFRD